MNCVFPQKLRPLTQVVIFSLEFTLYSDIKVVVFFSPPMKYLCSGFFKNVSVTLFRSSLADNLNLLSYDFWVILSVFLFTGEFNSFILSVIINKFVLIPFIIFYTFYQFSFLIINFLYFQYITRWAVSAFSLSLPSHFVSQTAWF